MRIDRLALAVGILLLAACATEESLIVKYPNAEEMWCDDKITEIDRARASIVAAYDSGDRIRLRSNLQEMNRLRNQLDGARMLGETCAFHMFSGGRSTSPTRYREASRLCLESRRMLSELR